MPRLELCISSRPSACVASTDDVDDRVVENPIHWVELARHRVPEHHTVFENGEQVVERFCATVSRCRISTTSNLLRHYVSSLGLALVAPSSTSWGLNREATALRFRLPPLAHTHESLTRMRAATPTSD